MIKSGVIAYRIVHIICGLDAWMLHGVFGSKKEQHRSIPRKLFTVDNNSDQREVVISNMKRSYIDHLCVLVRGVLLPVLALQDRSAIRSNRQPKLIHGKNGDLFIPVLIELQGGNNDVAGVDANRCARAIGLVPLHTVDVDDPFFAVDLGHFAFPTLELSSYDQYLVVFTHR